MANGRKVPSSPKGYIVALFLFFIVRKPHTASLVLHIGESAEFDVVFQPSVIQQIEGLIHLSIMDNQYEETTIQMVGEGYQDDVTLGNLTSLMAEGDGESAERRLEEDILEGE